jgi:hypothetical protein
MRSGDFGVGMFFVLSGFLLSLPFWSRYLRQQPMPSLKVYFARRLARIVPAYYLCVAILVLALGLYTSKWELLSIATMFTFTNSLIAGMYKPDWNDPLWSIPIEIHFYLYLPLLMYGLFSIQRRKFVAPYFITVLGVIAVFQFTLLLLAPTIERLVGDRALFSATMWSTTKNSVVLFAHFIIGVIAGGCHLAIAVKPETQQSLWRYYRYDLVVLIAATLICSTFVFELYKLPGVTILQYDWPAFPLLIALLLFALPRTVLLSKAVELKFFKVTALLSYGIYLWHVPVLRGLEHLMLSSKLEAWSAIFCFGALALAVTYLVSLLSYYLVERHVLRWAKKIK